MNTSHRPTPSFDALLEQAAAWVLLGTLGWGAVLVLAAVVERLSAGRLPALGWVGCPRRVRPLLLAAVGLAVLLPGAAAQATPGSAGGSSGEGGGTGRALPAPSRPVDDGATPTHTAPLRQALAPRPAPATAPGDTVTVRPGDSLWSLSAERLGPRSRAAEVAVLVEGVHRLNREVVGPDPDLLRPGQQLRFPVVPPPLEAP